MTIFLEYKEQIKAHEALWEIAQATKNIDLLEKWRVRWAGRCPKCAKQYFNQNNY